MFILHVDIMAKPGSELALEKTYVDVFRPAVSSQEGFDRVELLRSNRTGVDYLLSIAFDLQASQQNWVASDLHQQVWPEMESQCESCAVKDYTSV